MPGTAPGGVRHAVGSRRMMRRGGGAPPAGCVRSRPDGRQARGPRSGGPAAPARGRVWARPGNGRKSTPTCRHALNTSASIPEHDKIHSAVYRPSHCQCCRHQGTWNRITTNRTTSIATKKQETAEKLAAYARIVPLHCNGGGTIRGGTTKTSSAWLRYAPASAVTATVMRTRSATTAPQA